MNSNKKFFIFVLKLIRIIYHSNLSSMNIVKKIRQGVKVRFTEKGKNKISRNQHQLATKKSKSRELYTDNEDLGFC